jgi:hypothetical protein
MTLSREEAKTRLADYNILLKYMSFLQNNGLSECGKGQIIGQIFLLQEFLEEEGREKEQRNNNDKSYQQQQQEKEQEKQQQVTIKDPAAGNVGKIMTESAQENAVDNIWTPSKSGLLRQVGNLIDKAKDITIEGDNEINYTIIDHSNKWQRQQKQTDGGGVTANNNNNKVTDESWINKIKRAAEVENWR